MKIYKINLTQKEINRIYLILGFNILYIYLTFLRFILINFKDKNILSLLILFLSTIGLFLYFLLKKIGVFEK